MEPLAKLVVSLIELAETELAMLKQSIVKLGLSLAMVLGAGVLGTIGFCWVLNAIFLLLKRWLGEEAAFAISGIAFLGLAGALVWMALRVRRKPAVAAEATPAPHAGGTTDGNQAPIRLAS